MPVFDFQRHVVKFDALSGGLQSQLEAFVFPAKVLRAEAVLSGFFFEFVDDDHPVYQVMTGAKVTGIISDVVKVEVDLGIRDHTGNWDDKYTGTSVVTVIALLADPE